MRDFPYNPDGLVKRGNFIDINATLHKRSLLDEVGNFDEDLKTLEDWDLFARITLRYPFKVKHVSQVLGEYFFFLRETESTSVNSFLTNEALMSHFHIGESEGDRKKY